MIYKKSVVLSSIDNSLKKAVLNLDGKTGKIKGEVKLYNFTEEPMTELSLGLLIDQKIHKINLSRVGYMAYTSDSVFINIPENCTCALFGSKSGKSEPLLLGAISGSSASLEERLISGLRALEQTSASVAGKILSESKIEFDDDEEIEEEIDNCLKKTTCENCTYKSVFYKNKKDFRTSSKDLNNFEYLEKNINSDKNSGSDNNSDYKNSQLIDETKKNIKNGELKTPTENSVYFFDEISSQINKLFDNYPTDEILCDIIPNSKWVKVDYENDEKFYVVGLIYSNSEVKYVCYGFPAMWTKLPPADFNEKAQWLPIDVEEPHGNGYWITYQDAQDGEMVRVDII
ncbi:MAG: hypothetical protein PHH71_02960 [Clostridia bacterium]|jgi:hypothetical protein|nr:hypothetical protein [Clostridia bacterium]MDD3231787.1 hypothetical protein [Clostridia bacterium]MDD4408413.1 hypothetical protein [Clostridia bacterium]